MRTQISATVRELVGKPARDEQNLSFLCTTHCNEKAELELIPQNHPEPFRSRKLSPEAMSAY